MCTRAEVSDCSGLQHVVGGRVEFYKKVSHPTPLEALLLHTCLNLASYHQARNIQSFLAKVSAASQDQGVSRLEGTLLGPSRPHHGLCTGTIYAAHGAWIVHR